MSVRVLILGCDGYLGWTLATWLHGRGYKVFGIDNLSRRRVVQEVGSDSAIPISPLPARANLIGCNFAVGDLTDERTVADAIAESLPDVIVHLGENPSAPYSMIDCQHAANVQTNNIVGTLNVLHAMRDACPDAHLVKLGTMGEYGTPNVDIPEGKFTLAHNGRETCALFPRQAGSWYHQSKVHGTHNIEMACRIWGLQATDVMQGVVYGSYTDSMGDWEESSPYRTRLDVDECFGTVIHRFCAQAVLGMPLTVYGKGGQTRGYLPLRDSMQCLQLAIDNPPGAGEYRTFNQFAETYSVNYLAEKVQEIGGRLGLDVTIAHVPNPRVEAEDHYYNPEHQGLFDIGYTPVVDLGGDLTQIMRDMLRHKDRLEAVATAVVPKIKWKPARTLPAPDWVI